MAVSWQTGAGSYGRFVSITNLEIILWKSVFQSRLSPSLQLRFMKCWELGSRWRSCCHTTYRGQWGGNITSCVVNTIQPKTIFSLVIWKWSSHQSCPSNASLPATTPVIPPLTCTAVSRLTCNPSLLAHCWYWHTLWSCPCSWLPCSSHLFLRPFENPSRES